MEFDNLYIIGGADNKVKIEIYKNSKVIFIDKEQDEYLNTISLIKDFQEKQNSLRENWLNFQEQVFNKIKPFLDKDEDFYYLLSNLFFEASPNKTNSIFKFFKIRLIIDYIKSKKIKNLFLYNVSKDIEIFFYSNKDNLNFSVKTLKFKKKKFFLKKIFKDLAKEYFISAIFKRLVDECKKKQKKKPYHRSILNKVVFSYYYPGGQTFKNSFSSKYFEKVSSLLNGKYEWLFLYIGNFTKLRKENELITRNFSSFGFLDFYFSLTDFYKIIIDFYRVRKKLKLIKYKKLFIFEELDYLPLIEKDWSISMSILLLDQIIFEKKISNFFTKNSQINEAIYLLEFQPWEHIFNKVAKRNNVKTKGVIHSVVRPNVMNYYHSKKIHPYLYMPSYVGVNSDFSRSLMIKNGFKLDQILKIEAQRFNYLLKNKSKFNLDKSRLKKTILIITSIIHNETKELLEFFASVNVKFEKVYIKEHHLFKVEPIIKSSIKNFPSFEIFEGTITDAFELSDIVFTANGSSVLLESVVNKKETVSVISLSSLPIPAIDKAPNLHFVNDADSLSKILKKLTERQVDRVINNGISNYLYLNDELSLWQDFLNK